MNLLDVIKNTLDKLTSGANKDLLKKAKTTDQTKRYQNFEKKIFSLDYKVGLLKEKVEILNEQIMNLTILNEELLYMFEKSTEKKEDKKQNTVVRYTPKKHELN